jgi:hypothetical protein
MGVEVDVINGAYGVGLEMRRNAKSIEAIKTPTI